MSGSNCCFLNCIQVSQEAVKVVWYPYLFKNFPQFIVIHTVKGFSVVNEAEVDVFLEIPCFFNDPTNVGNLISGSSAFSKSNLYIWKFSVPYLPGCHLLSSFSIKKIGAVLRWWRNRMGRPLSPQQIHQNNIWTPSKFHRTTSECWQRTSGTQKSRPLSSKGGRTKYKR